MSFQWQQNSHNESVTDLWIDFRSHLTPFLTTQQFLRLLSVAGDAQSN